jgi:superfamily II DNA/RNA helicase
MYIEVASRDKFEVLRKLIAATNPEKALVFVNQAYEINLIAEKLNFHDKATFAIHKGVTKEQRQNALESFRLGKINILVSSDISARGLDIQGITHVINLDFPGNTNEYLHRAGRTARGNNTGFTISLVTPSELAGVRIYEKTFGITIEKKTLYGGNLI